MYNSEQKEHYLKYKEQETDFIQSIIGRFEHIAPYEEELGKDLSNFTYSEIEEYYIRSNYKSISVLTNINSALKGYTTWCINNGMVASNINYYDRFTTQILTKYVNMLLKDASYITRDELLLEIQKLPNPREQFVLLAIFEYGKSKKLLDIGAAKFEDLHGNKLTLPSGRTVEVSDKLREIIIDSASAEKRSTRDTEYALYDDGTIIKATRQNARDNNLAIRQRVNTIFVNSVDYLGYKDIISIHSLNESGQIHMMKELMKKHNMTFQQFLSSEYKQEVEKQYGLTIIAGNYICKYGDIM